MECQKLGLRTSALFFYVLIFFTQVSDAVRLINDIVHWEYFLVLASSPLRQWCILIK